MTESALAERLGERLAHVPAHASRGRLTRMVGLEAEVRGVRAALGDLVQVRGPLGDVPAEVVAVSDDSLHLMPFGSLAGVAPGAPVSAGGERFRIRVGWDLRGRVLDALGRPIDGHGPAGSEIVDFDAPVPDPMSRRRIDTALPLGVRAVDTMLTCGRGQRVGIFAGSGVGKSTLLGMFARGTAADVTVVGLVGERGREVREFIEDDLGPEGQANAVTVVATSDEPALLRLRAAYTATRIAEWYRDQGADVLLLVDSLTRFSMARREIGLAAGEPPATRGYPPSVFAELPRLLERAGTSSKGSITALYTVLVEADDMNDPIADHARSILDGHIVLSRRLASAGHYPTIDVLESVSRLAGKICPPHQLEATTRLRQLLAAYEDARDLVEIGAYVSGTNALVDEALAKWGGILDFLRQDVLDISSADLAWEHLEHLVAAPYGGQT